ncbi:MAG: bifunctional oligoribonuclease/PAP phosphatase NrnA [Gemmatimonadetes bacterium]|nr:bifunctional oligoribonuclease/PAP phosphatase NrnA [Gemmatimonadota bacterium]
MPATHDLLAVPSARRAAIERIAGELVRGRTVVLSTHVNADGDGCGSEAALARLLRGMGLVPRIVNPTPWPNLFRFLLGPDLAEHSADGVRGLAGADLLVVLDISDVSRLGPLAESVRRLTVPRLVIDHHVAHDEPAGDILFSDIAACATGELVFDFAQVLGLSITPAIATALYVAMLTDTGGFRFSNTSPRCHAVAGQLLAAGVEPETIYRRVYQSVPVGRLHLLREVLGSLEHDPAIGLAWVSLDAGVMERHGVLTEDMDGIVEHPRSIAGTRLALFFRDLGHDRVKVSFRSTGGVDANVLARQFGGGGHAKASGALVAGSLADVRARVVDAARAYLKAVPAA